VASPGFVARRGKTTIGHSRWTSGPDAAAAQWLVLWLNALKRAVRCWHLHHNLPRLPYIYIRAGFLIVKYCIVILYMIACRVTLVLWSIVIYKLRRVHVLICNFSNACCAQLKQQMTGLQSDRWMRQLCEYRDTVNNTAGIFVFSFGFCTFKCQRLKHINARRTVREMCMWAGTIIIVCY